MKKRKLTREQFLEVFAGVKLIEKKGKVKKYKDWSRLNDTRIELEKIAEDHDKKREAIMSKTGMDKLEKRKQDAILKKEIGSQNEYVHSDEDIKIMDEWQAAMEQFINEEVEVKYHPIPERVIDDLPTEVLEARSFVYLIIDKTTAEKKGATESVE